MVLSVAYSCNLFVIDHKTMGQKYSQEFSLSLKMLVQKEINGPALFSKWCYSGRWLSLKQLSTHPSPSHQAKLLSKNISKLFDYKF